MTEEGEEAESHADTWREGSHQSSHHQSHFLQKMSEKESVMSQTQKEPVRISAELTQPVGMVFPWLQDPAGAVGSPGERISFAIGMAVSVLSSSVQNICIHMVNLVSSEGCG